MTNSKIAHEAAPVDHDDETTAAIAALDAAERAIAATKALLLARRPAADGSRRLTLEATRQLLGLKPSRGPDPHRSTRDRLRALGVPVVRVGHQLLVSSADLDAALAAQAKPLRGGAAPAKAGAPPAPPPAPAVPDRAAALRAAGIKLVAGGGR